jgi:hypothetical protein
MKNTLSNTVYKHTTCFECCSNKTKFSIMLLEMYICMSITSHRRFICQSRGTGMVNAMYCIVLSTFKEFTSLLLAYFNFAPVNQFRIMVINYMEKNGNHTSFSHKINVFSVLCNYIFPSCSLTCKVILWKAVFVYFTHYNFQTKICC